MGRLSTSLGRLREVELLFCCIWLYETKAVIGITLVRATTLLSFTFNPMVQKWGGYVDVLYQWSPGSIWGVMSLSSKHFLNNILLNFNCNFCLSKYSTTPVVTAVTTISTTTSNTVLHFFCVSMQGQVSWPYLGVLISLLADCEIRRYQQYEGIINIF